MQIYCIKKMMKKLNLLRSIDKKNVLFIIVSLIILCITILTIFFNPQSAQLPLGVSAQEFNKNSTYNYTSTQDTSQESSEIKNETADSYLVTIENEKICVYKNDEPIPLEQDVVAVSSLNFTDKILLEQGVHFSSHNDMINFLQNYE